MSPKLSSVDQPFVFVIEASDEQTETSNKRIVLLSRHSPQHGDVIYSPDGQTLYALAVTGSSGGATGTDITRTLHLFNPHDDTSSDLIHVRVDASDFETVTYQGESYVRDDNAKFDSSKVVPLPDVHSTDYFCRTGDDSTIVYVRSNKYKSGPFELFTGGPSMESLPNNGAGRDTKTGDAFVISGESVFTFLAESEPDKPVGWWDKRPLFNLEEKDYDIVETEDGLTITKKG